MALENDCSSRLAALLRACDRPGRVLILMQDNPDPDAIGSAWALREILRVKLHKRAVIGYGGSVGRAENQALLDVLKVPAKRIGVDDFGGFKTICLVDTQPRTGNNALPEGVAAQVVIDHHKTDKHREWKAAFSDVRPSYGASATMLWEYLQAAEISPSSGLATAMLYGIQSDTQELGGDTNRADPAAFQDLFFLADKRKLAAIRRAPVDAEYFDVLRDSLERSVLAGRALITFVNGEHAADMFAEIADRMLRLRGAEMSVCFGRTGTMIYISARSSDPKANCCDRMRRVVKGIGTGGGHRMMAGGQVRIGEDRRETMRIVYERVLWHFARNKSPEPLLAEGHIPFPGNAPGKPKSD